MSESTELTVIERAAVALGADEGEKQLIALAKKYVDITDIKNPAGRTQCHAAAMELSNARIHVDKTGKAAREDANAFQKAVIAEVARRVAIIKPEEDRLLTIRDTWDAEREAEKAARLAAEQQRIAAIRAKIEEIKDCVVVAMSKTADEISSAIAELESTEITLEEYFEFSGEAQAVQAATVAKLKEKLSAQIETERVAIEAARQAEADRIERERMAEANRAEAKRLADLAAELEREAQLAHDRQALADKQAREQREAAEREQRAANERAAAAMQAELAQHEARMAAERAEIKRQQDEIDAAIAEQERVARVAREAAEAAEKLEADHAEALIENARIDAAAELLRQQAVEARMRREQQERERAETLAARYAPEPTSGTWSVGKAWGSVVTTAEIVGSPGTGHNDAEYYGGNLICESVWRPADACVLAAAHDMFDLLHELIDIEGPQPGNNEWVAKVKAVLAKATYVPEIQPEAQAA